MYSVEIDLFIMKAEDVLFRVAMRLIISVRERGEDATAEIASEIQKPGVNRSDDYPVGRCLPCLSQSEKIREKYQRVLGRHRRSKLGLLWKRGIASRWVLFRWCR